MTKFAPRSVFVILPHPGPFIRLQLFSIAALLALNSATTGTTLYPVTNVLGEKLTRFQVQCDTGQPQQSASTGSSFLALIHQGAVYIYF